MHCSALTQGEGSQGERDSRVVHCLHTQREDNQFILGQHDSRKKPFESCHHKDARYHCTSFYPEEQHTLVSLAHISGLRRACSVS